MVFLWIFWLKRAKNPSACVTFLPGLPDALNSRVLALESNNFRLINTAHTHTPYTHPSTHYPPTHPHPPPLTIHPALPPPPSPAMNMHNCGYIPHALQTNLAGLYGYGFRVNSTARYANFNFQCLKLQDLARFGGTNNRFMNRALGSLWHHS